MSDITTTTTTETTTSTTTTTVLDHNHHDVVVDTRPWYSVRCHCGQVQGRFRFQYDPMDSFLAWDCNCSDCWMRRNIHTIVPQDDFQYVSSSSTICDNPKNDSNGNIPEDNTEQTPPQSVVVDYHHEDQEDEMAKRDWETKTTLYQWGTKTAIRRFCKVCGILPWYTPRSNPDGVAITVNCIDWNNPTSTTTNTITTTTNHRQPHMILQSFDGIHWEDSMAQLDDATREQGIRIPQPLKK